MLDLPQLFLERMKGELGDQFPAFLASYDRSAYKGLRVNVAKITVEDFQKISPFALSLITWTNNGFYITEEKPGRHPFHQAGLYYCQEPSAMSAAPLLDVQDGERVLDLCSAPGGKGTELSARNPHGITILNEINFSRAKILSQNVERMGLNAIVTCASPEQLASEFAGYFDKILVDAPCSGEGMFLKEEYAIPEWSPENVQMCADRQQGILDCANTMLRGGGRLVYSTCTFAPQEDEDQVQHFLNSYPYTLISQKKIYPHQEQGEGHFVACLQKEEGEEQNKPLMPCKVDKKSQELYRKFEQETFGGKLKMENLCLVGNQLYALPNQCPKCGVQVLRAGIQLGEVIKDRFEPSHALAMAVQSQFANCVPVDEQTAQDYLFGLTIPCNEALKGWCLVTIQGYALGWGKAVNGTLKNHYPKGLRIS